MKFIYFAVTSAKSFNDSLKAFEYYFVKEGGFTDAFLLALGIAAAFAILYYVIARLKYSWSSLASWLITLVICGAASFWAAGYQTGIHDRKGALPHAVEHCWEKKTKNLTKEEKVRFESERADLKREFKQSYLTSSPVNRLCWTNAVISMVCFYGFSIIINGFSIGGANTPHRGLFTKRNK